MLFLIFLMCAMLLLQVDTASAFRCGTRLVDIGDTRYEVLSRCGPPTWQDMWQEERIERIFTTPAVNFNKPLESRRPIAVVVYVPVEEWTYNLGPSQFVRILRFENNRLISVETGGYGY
jgi:hypothetical protein